MLGTILVKVTFISAIFACVLYLVNYRKKSDEILRYARMFYFISVAGVISVAATLIYLIMTHQFQYYYVWNYSSTDLPGPLLFSTFYAGQEGSFLLWALYTGIVGVFLVQYSRKKGYETELMLVFTSIFTFLLLMLIVKNPFRYIWEQFPNELMRVGQITGDANNYAWIDKERSLWSIVPIEGKGLNPLLQNYWMVIHPQILFMGFTSMSIPFAYAVAGMLKRDYISWIRIATPWTVYGALMLGTGIILGGYWAYETLGWGGYWGWDPVENSSLVPWLVCIASIHTMLAQRKNGTYIKTNFILSILCFLLVLYSTFLTRSGVLGETSVHSFVEAGMWVYWLLLGVILTFAVMGFGLFFNRMKEMPIVAVEHSIVSREFALFLGASALVFASMFILIGTSSPIITNILKGKISAVDPSYYITTTLPLGILIALLSGIGQLLWWKNSQREDFLKQLIAPGISATVLTVVTYLMGAHHPTMLIFIFATGIGLFTNMIVGFRIIKGNPKMAGGAIAHIGIALMFLGFVSSAKYDRVETVSLEQGKSVNALGYKMTYIGYEPKERGRFAFNVELEKDGQKHIVSPVMFQSGEDAALIRNPDIINMITKDIYVSPLSLESPSDKTENELTMYQGQTTEKDGIAVKYLGYDFTQSKEKGNYIVAKLEVTRKGKLEVVQPTMTNMRGNVSFTEAKVKDGSLGFTIKSLQPSKDDAAKSNITFTISGISTQNKEAIKQNDVLVVEASIKPYINLVWLGTFSLIAGFLITIFRRAKESFQSNEWK